MPKIVDEQTREATRARVLREAAVEFARLGFDQANINVIAEQAGIGKGTIYLYFENKREVFIAMLRSIAQSQLSTIRASLATEGTLQQRLERLFRAFARLSIEESDNFNVYMSALYGVNRAFQDEATKLLRSYIGAIGLVLEEERVRNELQCSDIESTALMILSLTESFVQSARVLGQSEREIEKQAKQVAQFITQGMNITL